MKSEKPISSAGKGLFCYERLAKERRNQAGAGGSGFWDGGNGRLLCLAANTKNETEKKENKL